MLDRRIRRLQTLLIAVVLTVTVTGAVAGDFSNGPSLQGFTGIMNVPTANVQKEGTMAFWYGKQKDGTQAQYGDNYFFSTGMFSLLEIGGRVAVGNSAGANDLSAQFKVTTAPFTPKDRPWFPTLAVGAQDVGGQASHYNTTYLVATEEISRFRLSLGYGFGSNQTGRLKGLFAGGEIKAFDWLYLLGEYDAKDTNLGLRVISPDLFGYPVNLQSMIKSAVSNNPGTIDFTLGFQFAMGRDWHRKPTAEQHSIIPTVHPEDAASQSPLSAITTTAALPIPATGTKVSEKVASKEDDNLPVRAGAEIVARASVETTPTGRETLPVKAGAEVTPAGVVAVALSKDGALRGLRDRLVADGFMNVRVGTKDHELILVEYENARYNQSQLDGIGVVLGMVSDTVATDYQTVRLVLKIQGLRMLQLSMPSAPLRTFLGDAAFNDSLGDLVEISSTVTEERDVAFLEEASFANWFRSRLVLAPRLTTFLATEISSLDYLLAFAPTLTVDLWKGALLNITGTIPVVWSKGFDDDYPFRASRNDPQVETVMLNQALRIHPDFMISLGAGMIQHDVYGTLNEAYWYSKGGEHRLGFQQGFGRDNTYKNFDHTAYLGSYRYTYTPLDTSLTLTAGSFWENDRGARADLTRFFGDTALSVFYKFCRTTDNLNYQMGGVQFSFPLTPRQGMKPYPVQVKGPDEWRYRQESVTKSPDGHNYVSVAIGNTPPMVNSVTQVYYDRDRLTPEYIKSHLLRVRDAYIRYVHPE